MRDRTPDVDHMLMYSDHVHAVSVPLRRRERLSTKAATVISEPRRPWYENAENVVRFELKRLECYQRVNLEGVEVERLGYNVRKPYQIGGKKHTYEEAVARVCEAANESGEAS